MNFKAIIIFLLFINQTNQSEICYKNITPTEFNNLITNNKAVIIDVRLLKEYEKERIDNAFLASNSKILEEICNQFDKNDTIVIYCDKGDRSAKACEIICSKYKFTNVYNLIGGIIDWEKKGFPVDKSEIKYDD